MELIPTLTFTCSGQLIPCGNFQVYLEMLQEKSPLSPHIANTDRAWGGFSDPWHWLETFKIQFMEFFSKNHPHLPEAERDLRFILMSHWIHNFCQNLAQILDGCLSECCVCAVRNTFILHIMRSIFIPITNVTTSSECCISTQLNASGKFCS